MRIAAFIPSVAAGTGGTERSAAALLREFARRGHEVVLFTSDVEGQDLGAVEVSRVPRLARPSPAAYASFMVSAALRRRAERPFDIVYSPGANTLAADVVTAHYSAARGRKLLRSGELALAGSRLRRMARSAFFALAERAERRLYRSARCRRIIAVSERLKGDLVEDYDLEYDKLAVIPDGVDPAEFNVGLRASAGLRRREQLGLAPGEILALFMGGDWERKGLATLLEAFSRLSAKRAGLKLAVVGQGDAGLWGRRAAELGLSGRVTFCGPTSRAAEWYAAADFLVLPTRYEPFGLPPVEAAACGTPAVFSALAGSAEVLPDGECALHLADPRDPAELCMKMETLAADEELRRRLTEGARAAVGRWDWSRVAAETEAVFDAALAAKKERERD